MSSSSSNSKAKRSIGLQGPKPQPLSLTTRPSKKPHVAGSSDAGPAGPVIIYERTPRIIHAGPDEFMSVVQRLTGKQQSSSTSTAATLPEPEATSEARDDDGNSTLVAAEALVIALGQQQRAPCGDGHPGPSTSPGAAAFHLSPSNFISSRRPPCRLYESSSSANLFESAW